ncbi:MAG: XTP/dITP diphosphatase [Clostridia bacterium]|nr:XTP/dITP diphosphatase [Clostridia bacterium]
MKILLASHNKNKIAELQTLMSAVSKDIEVVSMSDIGYHDEIIEDGKTFEENALIKSHTGAKLGYITVADDSGLMVDALNGAPGVYSARYAGEDCSYEDNNKKLLSELKDVSEEKRTAKFVSVVTCSFPDGRADIVVRGECRGTILTDYRGEGGFGYDPLFWYKPMEKSFAEMTSCEKNSVSHRGQAMKMFADEFAKIKF